MDAPPPAYRPEWAPDYRPSASAPPGSDVELQPVSRYTFRSNCTAVALDCKDYPNKDIFHYNA